MAEPKNTLDPGLAARLPAEVRRILENQVPEASTYEMNQGILSGMSFAMRLLQAAPCSADQGREALAEAIRLKQEQLKRQGEALLPEFYARAKRDFTAEMLAEYADLDETTMVPSDQLMRELDQILHEADHSNGQTP